MSALSRLTVNGRPSEYPKIVVSHIYPPIPDRSHDWCAHYDGEEEAGGYGWGSTEAEAIQDFIENCQDDHNERLGLDHE